MPNVTHTKKIARALVERTGMPYTRARKQVLAAMEAGLLPHPYTDDALPTIVDILCSANLFTVTDPNPTGTDTQLAVAGVVASSTKVGEALLEGIKAGMQAGARKDPLDVLTPAGQMTVAVTSAIGGTGKTTTALMLAATIAQSSKKAHAAGLVEKPLKVVLVDMDTRDGTVGSLLGQYIPTALNIRVSPTWDKEETILAHLVHDEKLGIDALLAPVRPRDADDVSPDFYRQVIKVLKTTHDVVILDAGPNCYAPLVANVALPEATAILFVTTLAVSSVQGMARAMRELTEPVERGGMGITSTKIGLVVNQSVRDVGMEVERVREAAHKVPIVGAIPLATKDVLTCANHNRMHRLLKHPTVGPAYDKLAKVCMPRPVTRVKFEETGARWWTVRARHRHFVVVTQQVPFEKKGVLRYSVLDLEKKIRGPVNLIGQGWSGIETDRGCRVLARAMSLGVVEVSSRNNVPIRPTAIER